MWLEVEGFCDLVKRWWEEAQVEGYASCVVARKVKLVKEEIKKWNEEVFGDVKIRKYNILDSINILDVKEESSGLCNEELVQGKLAKEELGKNYSFG